VPLPSARLKAKGRVDAHGGRDGASGLVWTIVEPHGDREVFTTPNSPYAARFRDGAILYPRMLIFVDEQPAGPLQPKTQVAVKSRRGRLDKKPWKLLPDLTGMVESIFLRSAYLGEHCLPFRMMLPGQVIIPFEGSVLLSGDDERIDRYPGLADWWRRAEQTWIENRSSEKRTLLEQVDYIKQLSAQFPTPEIRVVYTKAGNYLTSAIISDSQAVIDHKLYWAGVASMEEAYYLTAILNAPLLAQIVEPYQSRGAFGARDFDKYVWYPPIPEYDGTNDLHRRLSELGALATNTVAGLEVPELYGFKRVRWYFRETLVSFGVFEKVDEVLGQILEIRPST
jgi:hypothetical protein